jgi:hypothetical protein
MACGHDEAPRCPKRIVGRVVTAQTLLGMIVSPVYRAGNILSLTYRAVLLDRQAAMSGQQDY